MRISKPASDKENKKNNSGPIINMYSIDSPITILFHRNLHTRVAGFLSEESEKAEMIKAVAGNNRERKVRKRGSVVWIWEGRGIPKWRVGSVGPNDFLFTPNPSEY